MKCSIAGCPGEYEDKRILHTMRYRGVIVVVDHVPAEVCSFCGDTLLKPETAQRLENLARSGDADAPARTVPLYEYA